MSDNNDALWIAAQTDVVGIAWGQPGTGKTRSIEAFGRALNRHVVSISLSQHEPTDIGGYPKPHDGYVEFLKPDFLVECKKRPSLLFLDELTTCSPATQASALRLLTHAKEILGDTLLVTAANPPGCAANGYQLEPPTVNRLYHHTWKVDNETWVGKLMNGFPQETASEYPVLPPNWYEQYRGAATALIGAYLRNSPLEAQKMPTTFNQDSYGQGCAWPSNRSWTNAATLLAAAMSLGMDGEKENHPICVELLHGCVGTTSAMKFLEWKKSLGFISWDETKKKIKANKFTEKDMPRTSDKAMAYLATMFNASIQQREFDRENADIAWKLWVHACNMKHKDIAVALKDILHNYCKPHMGGGKGYVIPPDTLKIASSIFKTVHTTGA